MCKSFSTFFLNIYIERELDNLIKKMVCSSVIASLTHFLILFARPYINYIWILYNSLSITVLSLPNPLECLNYPDIVWHQFPVKFTWTCMTTALCIFSDCTCKILRIFKNSKKIIWWNNSNPKDTYSPLILGHTWWKISSLKYSIW